MKEWAIYSNKTGARITGMGYGPDDVTLEYAQEVAEEEYGDDVYVAEDVLF